MTEKERNETRELRDELEEANRRAEENLRLVQRVQADFQNYRRRVEQEREEKGKLAAAEVILKLLPALDDFQRALEAIPSEARKQGWAQGVAMIQRKLQAALEAAGVTRIEAEERDFDPWEHEAVLHEESSVHDDGKVVQVLRDGYKLNGKVIRPAQVKVAKGPMKELRYEISPN